MHNWSDGVKTVFDAINMLSDDINTILHNIDAVVNGINAVSEGNDMKRYELQARIIQCQKFNIGRAPTDLQDLRPRRWQEQW